VADNVRRLAAPARPELAARIVASRELAAALVRNLDALQPPAAGGAGEPLEALRLDALRIARELARLEGTG
jgi:hypothetical protein